MSEQDGIGRLDGFTGRCVGGPFDGQVRFNSLNMVPMWEEGGMYVWSTWGLFWNWKRAA